MDPLLKEIYRNYIIRGQKLIVQQIRGLLLVPGVLLRQHHHPELHLHQEPELSQRLRLQHGCDLHHSKVFLRLVAFRHLLDTCELRS